MSTGEIAVVTDVEVLDGFLVRLTFADGQARRLDLERFLRGPVFEEIKRDPEAFRSVRVDPESGTIVWPNGADIDPDVLRGRFEPAWSADPEAS